MKRLLIANRGEIACRIARTARAMGIETVAIYSEADAASPHVAACDLAIALAGSTVSESYLNIPVVVEAAVRSKVDAVHPGYGFLSENAEFARACERMGLTFVGPKADVIDLMGSKGAAKAAAEAANVPCIPGFHEPGADDAALSRAAEKLNYPLMVKASAGGGGRGMRRVASSAGLLQALTDARREAMLAFGNDDLILEEALEGAKHIEVQILSDAVGGTVHIFERDCSVQRRHQKLIEEAPGPTLTSALRQAIGAAAVHLAQSVNYLGAGTVEFLLMPDGRFFFLEMNTRLQVEHGVTECITGIDLVTEQLKIAMGKKLSFSQEDLQFQGHAIQARLYAEDPFRQFMPQTGVLHHWRPAMGNGIRIDHALVQGLAITSYYDPMIAKVIAFGRDRAEAISRLRAALKSTHLHGVNTNKSYLLQILQDPEFCEGHYNTQLLNSTPVAPSVSGELLALAVAAFHHRFALRFSSDMRDWSNALPLKRRYQMAFDGKSHDFAFKAIEQGRYHIAGTSYQGVFEDLHHYQGILSVTINGLRQAMVATFQENVLYLDFQGHTHEIHDETQRSQQQDDFKTQNGLLYSPMDGRITKVAVQDGQEVVLGQRILAMEAMKMEHELKADRDGKVQLKVAEGDQVQARQLLAEIL